VVEADLVLRALRRIVLLLFFVFGSMVVCFANDGVITSVETYLNSVQYLSATFTQTDTISRKISRGMLYISRPGKLRMDYTSPFSASLYVNNSVSVYHNKDLDEITTVPTSTTPLRFLLDKKISLHGRSLLVTSAQNKNGFIIISLKEKRKPEQGTLVLKFAKHPMSLVSIELVNEVGQTINIKLSDIKHAPIKDSIFKFKNPRLKAKID